MPYASQRDRTPAQLERGPSPWPEPPLNVFVRSGYLPGVYNITWDDPSILEANACFKVIGVNVYRAFDSEYGPFERVTELPVGANFWRDQTDNVLEVEEDVSDRFLLRGECSATGSDPPRYVFRTLYPIVKEGSQAVPANSPWDVQVFVDGVESRALRVIGPTGEVELDNVTRADVVLQQRVLPVVPGPTSKVTCTYRRNRSLIKTDLGQRVFYRVATVAVAANKDPRSAAPEDLVETPLESTTAASPTDVEPLDYMWREAVRRNHWILQEGGERVKVFIHKYVGVPCVCFGDSQHKQPRNDCPVCYGTGILGGYEGPFDLIIAPDDAERRSSQKDIGRTIEHSYEVWTGPVPMLSMRDFIVKQDGDRYSIGPARRPSNRGMRLQQHFTIGHIDEKDIRYSVPFYASTRFTADRIQPSGPEAEASDAVTDKPNIPDEREIRGRTVAWEDITY